VTARTALVLTASALVVSATAAKADVDLLSPDTLHGVIDLRLGGADGEPSFTTEGFGKFALGGGRDGDFNGKFQLAEAAVEWTPRINWEWSAVVDAGHQPGQENGFDLYQAYVQFKPVPRSATRFKVRFGYFYPPVSLENDARVWGVTDTITPSAINSWIGEEIKVGGAELAVSHDFGDQSLEGTAGLFGVDDTAGALLSYRGWAFDDQKSQAFGGIDLPPLSPFDARFQEDESYSSREIDDRVGYYGKLEWRPPVPLTLEAFYYNNDGDRTSETIDQQWAWATQFADVGLTAQLGDHGRLAAQALEGNTAIGTKTHPLVDVDFQSAYLRVSYDVGRNTFTGRADVFQTEDNASRPPAPLSESGWALTGAWRRPLTKLLDLRIEAIHVESDRPGRVLGGEDAFQTQTLVQSSLRLTF
jgi:hypothetical protein